MNFFKFGKSIISLCISAVLLFQVTGCNNNKKNDKIKSSDYFCLSDVSLPDNFVCADDMVYMNDYLYLSGYECSSEGNRNISIVDIKNNKISDLNISDVPQGDITAIYLNEKMIYIAYKNNKSSTSGLCLIDRGTNKIVNDVRLESGTNISDLQEYQDGNILISMSSKERSYLLSEYDIEKAELKTKTDLYQTEFFEKDETIIDMLYADEKYCIITQNMMHESQIINMKIISEEGDLISEYDDITSDIDGIFENAYVNSRGNACIIVRNNSDTARRSVDEIQLSDGSILSRYDETFSEDNLLVSSCSSEYYDFLFYDENKIFGYNADRNEKTFITDVDKKQDQSTSYCYTSAYCNEVMLYSLDYNDIEAPVIYIYDNKGTNFRQIHSEEFTDTGHAQKVIVLSDGRLCILEKKGEQYFLVLIDIYGNILKKIEPDITMPGVSDIIISSGQNGEIFFAQCSKEKNQCSLVVMDCDGNIKRTAENILMSGTVKKIFTMNQEDYILYDSEKNSGIVSGIDYKSGALGTDNVSVLTDANIEKIYNMGENDIYYYTIDGGYHYNSSSGQSDELINWSQSDIIRTIDAFNIIDADKMACISTNYDGSHLTFLDRADKQLLDRINSKKIITLSGINIYDQNISREIEHFNDISQDYRICVNDYIRYDPDDTDECIKKLTLDIVSGNIPDILIGNSDMDLQQYASKGLFTDLNGYIDKDKDISRDDLMENILGCYTYNDKLSYIPLNYCIYAVVGKESVLGSGSEWTYDDFFRISDSRTMFYNCSREMLLELLIYDNLEEFVDFNKMTCDFKSDTFKKIAEYIYNNTVSDDEYKPYSDYPEHSEIYLNYFNRFNEDICCADTEKITSLGAVSSLRNGTLNGAKIVFKGVPSSHDSGTLVYARNTAGISNYSENKEGAWEFIKQLISDEYQDKITHMNSFPVNTSVMDSVMKTSCRTGFGFNTDGTFYETPSLTDDDVADFFEIIKNTHKAYTHDSTIQSIIEEELRNYFSDTQTFEETQKGIQSKVSLYLNEIK